MALLTPVSGRQDVRRWATGTRVRGRTLWLMLAALTLFAGAALNWKWLTASGALPLLLPALPCLAMCALHLCSRENSAGCDRSEAPKHFARARMEDRNP
ncbi:hypothetical protein OCA5_pOC16700390 (plasmid) [Afipia carboxidovorans OM5]|uniref:DUF2933 domain-containing protein n=1 Tax=Afipia carboxidovorans (strain ATCC 49405 / DSM 1227 / KCTC 32145 / OM5) TaxID=504832 RepID=F8C1C2_AFIC5|nr:hypothetical protein OCA4_pOC167B00390 [Afipia carboxidovorans OM4]AEI08237.1 hypothetical protein OCA5_pOC16700390 [Afipia carboxidovorans OM5]